MTSVSAERPPPALEDLHAYFRQIAGAFDAAIMRAGRVCRPVRIGGLRLEFQFAGDALAHSLLPAFAHLAADPAPERQAVIGVWDERTTDVPLPRPLLPGGVITRGLISNCTSGPLKSAWEQSSRGFSFFDAVSGRGFFHVPDAGALPPHESSFPLRTLLNWCLCARGLHLVHAGAVGTARGAALLAGMGGSGKSNTTLACLEAGLLYAGDDFVAVDAEGSRVHSLYCTPKLYRKDLARFPRLSNAVIHPGGDAEDKAVLGLHPRFREQLVSDLPLRAILLPRVAGGAHTVARRATPAEALRRIAPSTMIHLPGAARDEFRAMAAWAARHPSYFLDLGEDRAKIVEAIRNLVDQPSP